MAEPAVYDAQRLQANHEHPLVKHRGGHWVACPNVYCDSHSSSSEPAMIHSRGLNNPCPIRLGHQGWPSATRLGLDDGEHDERRQAHLSAYCELRDGPASETRHKTVRHCNAAIFPFRRLFDDLVGERSPCSGDQGS